MKPYVLFVLLLISSLSSCSQSLGSQNKAKSNDNKIANNQPNGSWQVNKEFDENGNLIKFDSIYTWSSSSELKEMPIKERDSIFKSLHSKLLEGFSSLHDDSFFNFFPNDSIINNNFFNDPFFQGQFESDFMNEIMEQMSNRRKSFIQEHNNKPIIPSEDERQI